MQLRGFQSGFTGAPCVRRLTNRPGNLNGDSIRRIDRNRRAVSVRANYGENPTIEKTSYLTVGLAHCFEEVDNGKLEDKFVIEPISAMSLECMMNGAKTCFKSVTAMKLEEAVSRDKAVFPEAYAEALFCENYFTRCEAAARTWTRSHAQDNLMDIVPLGQEKSKFNFSLDDKRVLNFENVVSDSDNIKQDMSIDVYGRKEEEEENEEKAPAPAPAPAPVEEEEEEEEEEDDDLDALLAG